ncbi:MAG: hypothetical protein R2883_05135 [Caldisericia bacterium]
MQDIIAQMATKLLVLFMKNKTMRVYLTYENHFGNDEYSEEDDNYYGTRIEEAFDTVSTSDGNIHLLWTEEYNLYKAKTSTY